MKLANKRSLDIVLLFLFMKLIINLHIKLLHESRIGKITLFEKPLRTQIL